MIRLVAYRAVAWRELPIATSDSPITEQLVRIKQLGHIAAVTRFGSPRRASEHPRVSQPALSEAV